MGGASGGSSRVRICTFVPVKQSTRTLLLRALRAEVGGCSWGWVTCRYLYGFTRKASNMRTRTVFLRAEVGGASWGKRHTVQARVSVERLEHPRLQGSELLAV